MLLTNLQIQFTPESNVIFNDKIIHVVLRLM